MRTLGLLLLLFPCALRAQDPAFVHHTPRNGYDIPEEAPPAYVLHDGVTLRAAPSNTARAVARLAVGTRLQLDSVVMDTLELDGVSSCWVQVRADGRTGYLWGGAIAQQSFGSTADPEVKFVAGQERYEDLGEGLDIAYRIVALRRGKELDRIVVHSFAWGFDEVRNHGDLGLENVDDVITAHMSCVGGCGCTTGDVVVFWSGGRLHHAADVMGSPDGDHSTYTTLLFPADMEGEAGAIIRVTCAPGDEQPRINEEGEADGYWLTRTKVRERLVWNGSALVASGAPVEEQYKVLVR